MSDEQESKRAGAAGFCPFFYASGGKPLKVPGVFGDQQTRFVGHGGDEKIRIGKKLPLFAEGLLQFAESLQDRQVGLYDFDGEEELLDQRST